MSYGRFLKPRIYTDTVGHLALRGRAFSSSLSLAAGTLNSGYNVLDLCDLRPLNRVSFDTSAHATTHIVLAFDLGDTEQTISFVALLNHNLFTAETIVRIAHHTAAITATGDGTTVSYTNLVGAMNELGGGEISSNGSHILTFTPVVGKRYWAIEFQDYSSFSATDLEVGSVMLGIYWDAPNGADVGVGRTTTHEGVKVQETRGGKRYASAGWITGDDGTAIPFGQPFRAGGLAAAHLEHAGRRAYDMDFTYLADTTLHSSDLAAGMAATQTLRDVFSRTGGGALPMIFTPDGTSTTPGDYCFSRLVGDLKESQVANKTWSTSLKIEEEF